MGRAIKKIYHIISAVLANYFYGFPGKSLTVIAVTGTDGKTTTTNLIYHMLKQNGIKASMISTVGAVIGGKTYYTGFHVTTPDAFAVQKLIRQVKEHGDTHVVLEVTSHAIDQYRVWGIPIAVGVLTNVTHEHLDYHKNFSDYKKTKFSLLRKSPIAIINIDDQASKTFLDEHYRGNTITYALHKKADYTSKNMHFPDSLPGEYNALNCLAAFAACDAIGIPKAGLFSSLVTFPGVIGRMDVLILKPIRVIVDFAHTPNALDKVLQEVKKSTTRQLIHVFGSAGLRDASKRPLMGRESEKYSDLTILTEEDYRTEQLHIIMDQISKGISPKHPVIRIGDRREAITHALRIAQQGDTVIITGKGHEGSLCRGTVEYPWSDIEETKKLISRYVHNS